MKIEPQDVRSVEELHCLVEQGGRPKYLFFWGHRAKNKNVIDKSCFSNWFPAKFEIDGLKYFSTEHHMMAQKAKLFRDEECLQKILKASSPAEAKSLGRKVKNFSENIWFHKRFQIVVAGNLAKFSQNPDFRDFLLTTKNRILVEASPVDKIWGIGLAADDKKIENPRLWKGLNLLGFALMEVRKQL